MAEEIQKVLNETKATKIINPFDELNCEIYHTTLTDPEPAEPTNATINYELGDDKMEGNGSFCLKYMFTGSSLTAAPEKFILSRRGEIGVLIYLLSVRFINLGKRQ